MLIVPRAAREAILAEARILGIDLLDVATDNPDGSSTLDWETLANAIEQTREGNEEKKNTEVESDAPYLCNCDKPGCEGEPY